jgi:hypothetical protein
MGNKPDLVDQAALAERLGVPPTTASRWFRRAILPPPDLRVGSTDLWMWETVRDWAGKRSRSLRKPKPRRTAIPVEIVDLSALARRLGVPGRTAASWHRRGLLPEPDYRWETTDGWLWDTIDRWARSNAGRVPGLFRSGDRATASPRDPDGPRLSVFDDDVPARPAESPVPPSRPVTTAAPAKPSPAAAAGPTGPPPPSAPPRPGKSPVPTSQPATVEGPAKTPPAASIGPIRAVARPVTVVAEPARPRSADPIGDIERIHRYFAGVAESLRTVQQEA